MLAAVRSLATDALAHASACACTRLRARRHTCAFAMRARVLLLSPPRSMCSVLVRVMLDKSKTTTSRIGWRPGGPTEYYTISDFAQSVSDRILCSARSVSDRMLYSARSISDRMLCSARSITDRMLFSVQSISCRALPCRSARSAAERATTSLQSDSNSTS